MARPHIEFIFAQALDWQPGAPLTGRAALEYKLLSHDDALGELTALVRVPAGWSGTVTGDFQEEVYVLDGGLAIGGIELSRDGYFRVPARAPHRWQSGSGCVAIIFLNVASDADDTELVAVATPGMDWDRSGIPPELDFMGLARKALFTDDDPDRHRTWLLSTMPQIAPRGQCLAVETHACAEEVFVLSGDFTGPRGAMTAGAYFWRPRDTFHGPFGSREGGLAISRFRHGVQDTIFHAEQAPFDFAAPYRPVLPPALAPLAATALAAAARY